MLLRCRPTSQCSIPSSEHASPATSPLSSRDSENLNEDSARRDIEASIFRRIADVLGGTVTLDRLSAAVAALLASDSTLVGSKLSQEERYALLDPNFIGMLGGDATSHLTRLSAALDAVLRGRSKEAVSEANGSHPARLPYFRESGLTIIAADPSTDSESRRRLDNLLAASLVDRIGQAEPCDGILIIVGADRLSRSVLEELTGRAAQRGLRIAMFFENLRGEARELLGRGQPDTIIMALGNYDDATAAANFIGKQHRFVVSSITLTVGTQFGGSDTHGFSVGDSSSYTNQHMGPDSITEGRSSNTSFSYAKTWQETENYGETSTRSEEFVARAEDLQRIPTTGFVYVTSVNGRQHVVFGDCHPAIASTPLVAQRAIARG